ncbi:citrate lyase acyl carrier protein [uncultured Anaerococcus sp.]|uniref:citrate lyase acyl carrier protein n=1 Tax=uncultured Anaerococcus sp. TaxID=293428 RepID=UPI00288B7D6B|nr:citrate lyase acyl carrier protein [uncultured Anaerococcus sp.]
MEIKKNSAAGTLESNDCLIRLEESDSIEIVLNSPVEYEFGDQIRKVVEDVLKEAGINKVRVMIEDKGALDCTIAARLKTAIGRAQ